MESVQSRHILTLSKFNILLQNPPFHDWLWKIFKKQRDSNGNDFPSVSLSLILSS